MIKYKNIRRGTLFKLVIMLVVLFFVVTQVLEIFFEVNYTAIPRYIIKKLGPSRTIQSSELLNSEYNVLGPNANIPNGFPRLKCDCDSSFRSRPLSSYVIKAINETSTCSNEASQFGLNQRVISYSLFMKDPEAAAFFLEGVEPNLDRIKLIFPGWQVRIYTDIPVNKYSCPFICKYDFLFWCNIKDIPKLGDLSAVNGRLWRYLPVGDPTVDVLISRDLDSTTSQREREAVAEWEASDKTVHVMRDSQWHDTEILAGLWGIKNFGFKPGVAQELQETLMRIGKKKQSKFWDQDLAEKYIYFPFKKEVMSHDSYFCGKFPDAVIHPFPTQRVGEEFVGHDDRKEMDILIVGRLHVCPEQCRPTYGKSWKYC